MRVEFHPEALRELEEAQAWYRERSELVAQAFASEVAKTVERILTYPKASATTRDNERQSLLKSFPFSVIYRIHENDVFFTAFAHQRRRPGYWHKRM